MSINSGDYIISFKLNNEDWELEDSNFVTLKIIENYEYSTFLGVLLLNNNEGIFDLNPLVRGSNLTITLKDGDNNEETIEFLISNTTSNEYYKIDLIPKFFRKMYIEKFSKAYNDSFQKIIKSICEDNDITVDDNNYESGTSEKKNFYQIYESNTSFINKNLKYCKNTLNNYIYFIDKYNYLKLYSINKIKNRESMGYISSSAMKKQSVIDKTNVYQYTGGLGSKIFYFNWDEGTTNNYVYKFDKKNDYRNESLTDLIGVVDKDINEDTNIIIYPSISENLDYWSNESHIKGIAEYEVLRKNYFNIFINCLVKGNLRYSPMEKIEINYSLYEDNKHYYNGFWVIYNVEHIFMKQSYMSNLLITNSSYYNIENDKVAGR